MSSEQIENRISRPYHARLNLRSNNGGDRSSKTSRVGCMTRGDWFGRISGWHIQGYCRSILGMRYNRFGLDSYPKASIWQLPLLVSTTKVLVIALVS